MFSDFRLPVNEPPVLVTVDTTIMAKGEEFAFDGNTNIGATDQDIISVRVDDIIFGGLGQPSDWLMDCSIGTGNKSLLGKELRCAGWYCM